MTKLIERLAAGSRYRSVVDRNIGNRGRCLLQLINVGAQVLETGVAMRAADIDVVWVHGYGLRGTSVARCFMPTASG